MTVENTLNENADHMVIVTAKSVFQVYGAVCQMPTSFRHLRSRSAQQEVKPVTSCLRIPMARRSILMKQA